MTLVFINSLYLKATLKDVSLIRVSTEDGILLIMATVKFSWSRKM